MGGELWMLTDYAQVQAATMATGTQLSHQMKFSDDLIASLFLCHIYHMYSIYTCIPYHRAF